MRTPRELLGIRRDVRNQVETLSETAPTPAPSSSDFHADRVDLPQATPRQDAALPAALNPSQWMPAARDELNVRLAKFNLQGSQQPIQDLERAELALAQSVDARVSSLDMRRATERSIQAQQLRPAPQSDLFAFNALLDAKVKLTSNVIRTLAARAIKSQARHSSLRLAAKTFNQALRQPGRDGGFAETHPANEIELVASMIRQMVGRSGSSLQLTLSEPLEQWLQATLKEMNAETSIAMGGAGGFCANLASQYPEVKAHFFSAEPLSREVAERLADNVRVVDADGNRHRPLDYCDDRPPRVNLIAEYPSGMRLKLFGQRTLDVGGVPTPMETTDKGRVILSKPASLQATFGTMSDEALRKLAASQDLVFTAGVHYHTRGSSEQSQQTTSVLAHQLEVMRDVSDQPLGHLQYVVPKSPENEAAVMDALRKSYQSISLNSVEIPGLLNRLRAAGIGAQSVDVSLLDDPENPMLAIKAGTALQEVLQTSRVHLHGRPGDVLILQGTHHSDGTLERQTLAMLRARQVAGMKASNPSGEVRTYEEEWTHVPPGASGPGGMAPIVDGRGLAGLYAFADALAVECALTDAEKERFLERWWHRDVPSGRTYVFVPTRGIHDAKGGTVSLGDSIDGTALVFGLEPNHRLW